MNEPPIPHPGDPPQTSTQRDEAAGAAALREVIFGLRDQLVVEIAARNGWWDKCNLAEAEIAQLRKALCLIGTKASQDDGRFSEAIQEMVEAVLVQEDKS